MSICPPRRIRIRPGVQLRQIAKQHGFALPRSRGNGPDSSRIRQRLRRLLRACADAEDGALVPMEMLFGSRMSQFMGIPYERVRARILKELSKDAFKAFKILGPHDAREWHVCPGETPALWVQREIKSVWLSGDACRRRCVCEGACSFHFRSATVRLSLCCVVYVAQRTCILLLKRCVQPTASVLRLMRK